MKKLIVLVAALVMVAGYASAAEWDFYGSARVSTFFTSVDAQTAGTADVDNFAMGLQGNSRVGANVKVSDELSGRFEVGNSSSTWNTRLIYGKWDFGGGNLVVGQTYTPLNMFYSNQVYGGDTDLLAYGGVYSGRAAVLQLQYGGFKIAITPATTGGVTVGLVDGAVTSVVGPGGVVTYTANAETDDYAAGEVSMPAFEASYGLKMGNFGLALAGGYQSYEIVNGTTTLDVDSYVLALGADVKFGMGYLKANVYTGQNPGNLIWINTGGSAGLASANATTVLDNDVTGYLIVAGAKINDMFSVEFGYATASSEVDLAVVSDDVNSYYAQATVTLAPGVYIVPEIGVVDNEELGQTKTTYFGAKWQINF
jgi:hypothetical protein